MNSGKSIILNNNVSITKVEGENILVHFLMDAEGTLFLQYNPTEMLDIMDQDLYFLAHPNGRPDMVKEKIIEIARRNKLEDLLMSINVPNIYAVCDIFASKWLSFLGYTEQEIAAKRTEIEVKMRKWNDPSIIEHLTKKYPGLAITVLTQASPEEYIKKSYEETLKNTGAGIIIAPGYLGTSYTKMDSELYKLIKENRPVVSAFIDDDARRKDPAKEGGIDVVRTYAGEGKEELKAASEDALDSAYSSLRRQ